MKQTAILLPCLVSFCVALDVVVELEQLLVWPYYLIPVGLVFTIGLFCILGGRTSERTSIMMIGKGAGQGTDNTVENYKNFFEMKKKSFFADGDAGEESEERVNERKSNYTTLVNAYYDIATDFYEYGWGESFHFATRHNKETLRESIRRHEHWLALQLGLKPGMHVLDVGCGVGGPMMEIARFSGARVTGINNNAYQISRGVKHVERAGLAGQCDFRKSDFMHLPFDDNSVDAVYAIEATCHAPDKVACFSEMHRVLKPGGVFGGYEWCMTDQYDSNNKYHVAIKKGIELGNGLPDLVMTWEVDEALRDAGYVDVRGEDRARLCTTAEFPWYEPIQGKFTFSNWRTTWVGRTITHTLVWVLETLHISHKGAIETHKVLAEAAVRLVQGGETDTFTPMYFFFGRKPGHAAAPTGRDASGQYARRT